MAQITTQGRRCRRSHIDRVIAWYEKGMEERAPTMIYMKVAAAWDAARADPRFQAVLRPMNFSRLVTKLRRHVTVLLVG